MKNKMIGMVGSGKKRWITELPYLLLGVLIGFFLLTHTPNYTDYDAPSYINFDSFRPPLYPVFIRLFSWAGQYQFNLIVWLHGLFSFSALLYARYWLKKHLQVADFLIFILCVFVTVTILFHFQLLLIGAEGLTFPLFIMTFFTLVDCFKTFKLKKVIFLAIGMSLLALTRLQLYYFYILFLMLLIWYFWKGIPLKLTISAVFIFLVSVSFCCLADGYAHYLKHGSTSSVAPATGRLLIVQPLFLMTSLEVVNNFKNPAQQKYVRKMFYEMKKRNLNSSAYRLTHTKPSYYELAYEEYNKNYDAITQVVIDVFSEQKPLSLVEESKITREISKVLTLHAIKKNLLFLLWKFVNFVGSIPALLFFIIILSASLVKIIFNRTRKINYPQLFAMLIPFIIFLNAGVVAMFEGYVTAYFCYSQFLFYCLGAFFADQTFFKKLAVDD